MWISILPAAAVIGAEAALRRRVNALPEAVFPVELTPRVQLRRVHNRGLAGGRLQNRPGAVKAVQTGATALIFAATAAANLPRRAPAAAPATRAGLGLVLGGALANLLEHYIKGEVTDYVYLNRARLPLLRHRIWNAADGSIVLGACLAAAGMLTRR